MASPTSPVKNQSGFGQAFNETKSKVQDAASQAADKAKETASTMADKAKDMAASVAHTAGEAATTVGHKADDAVGAVGTGIKNLGGTVREKAPHEGMLGTASSGVAGALESSGRFIEREKLSGMAGDVTNFLKENPFLGICIGVGLGFALAQLISSTRR